MFSQAAELVAVVEIDGTADGTVQSRIAFEAYQASAAGVIGLILHGVSPTAMNSLLDLAVSEVGLTVAGVIYLEESQAIEQLRRGDCTPPVVAFSRELRGELSANGIPWVDLTEKRRTLRDLLSTPRAARPMHARIASV